MKIQTKFMNEVEIDKAQVVHFPSGLPGFESEKEFALLPLEEDSPFIILQSIQNEHISFVLGFSFIFHPNYSFEISNDDKDLLRIKSEEDVITYSIVTLREQFNQSTLNLKAPILINVKERIGKQVILHDEKFPLRYPISKEDK